MTDRPTIPPFPRYFPGFMERWANIHSSGFRVVLVLGLIGALLASIGGGLLILLLTQNVIVSVMLAVAICVVAIEYGWLFVRYSVKRCAFFIRLDYRKHYLAEV